MTINWTITKKRGNHRPVLEYTVTLNEFECGLCMPAVQIKSAIPKPPDAGWQHCWPGENERAEACAAGTDNGADSQCHYLSTPSHRTATLTETLRLPWRADNAYPEIEASFAQLRDAFEQALRAAGDSAPMHEQGALETTPRTRTHVAPAFAAERILRAARS